MIEKDFYKGKIPEYQDFDFEICILSSLLSFLFGFYLFVQKVMVFRNIIFPEQ